MNRQELYGTNFGWYMRDANGAIALFLSGYGPIPKVVLADSDRHREVGLAIERLPDISAAYLGSDGREVVIDANNSVFKEVKAAAKGLYVYDNEEYSDVYTIIAIPKVAIAADDSASTVGVSLLTDAFSDLEFRSTRSLHLKEYFDCE